MFIVLLFYFSYFGLSLGKRHGVISLFLKPKTIIQRTLYKILYTKIIVLSIVYYQASKNSPIKLFLCEWTLQESLTLQVQYPRLEILFQEIIKSAQSGFESCTETSLCFLGSTGKTKAPLKALMFLTGGLPC